MIAHPAALLDAAEVALRTSVEEMAATLKQTEKGKLSDILRFFNNVRVAYDAMDDQRKEIFKQIEHLSRNVIPDRMAEEGVNSMTVDGLRYTVTTKTSTSITDKEKGYEWLRAEGHDDIIQMTVNSSTLSAFARNYMVDTGRDLPEFFKMSTMKYTSVTKT